MSSRNSLPFSARSLTSRNTVNYYREKQKLLQEINHQVKASQAIVGRISAFKRQEEQSIKRM
jgi:two-component sensor histidine kinase